MPAVQSAPHFQQIDMNPDRTFDDKPANARELVVTRFQNKMQEIFDEAKEEHFGEQGAGEKGSLMELSNQAPHEDLPSLPRLMSPTLAAYDELMSIQPIDTISAADAKYPLYIQDESDARPSRRRKLPRRIWSGDGEEFFSSQPSQESQPSDVPTPAPSQPKPTCHPQEEWQEGEPVARDYGYENLNPNRTDQPPNKPFTGVKALLHKMKRGEEMSEEERKELVRIYFIKDFRPTPADSVPRFTNSQEYQDTLVPTPIVSPCGSIQFPDNWVGSPSQGDCGSQRQPIVAEKPNDFITGLRCLSRQDTVLFGLEPAFEIESQHTTDVRSTGLTGPLSPLSSNPSGYLMDEDMKEMEPEPPEPPPRPRRLSSPTCAMSSLSLQQIGTPPREGSRETTPLPSPSRRYSLRSSVRVSPYPKTPPTPPASAPSSPRSLRRNPRRDSHQPRSPSTPRAIQQAQSPKLPKRRSIVLNAAYGYDPLTVQTKFVVDPPMSRKRSRREDHSETPENDDRPALRAKSKSTSQRRARSRKTRKIT